jgi:4-hydroxybenzoyl-CoA thioesterase
VIYRRPVQIEFNHCDPAGIVFYPRYFEMVNSVIENFFADMIRYPFRRIHLEEGAGVPTVHIEADFLAPSRLGDVLGFSLEIEKIGGASATFDIRAAIGDEARLAAKMTLVWVTPEAKAAAWPEVIRSRMRDFQDGQV